MTPPYRTPAELPPEPPPPPPPVSAQLGSLRSLHPAPSLGRALVGPVLIAALGAGIGAVIGGAAIALPVAAATLAALAWSPIRMRGVSVALHAGGLVVSWRGSRDVVLFEDVDELWLDIERLHSAKGPRLMSLRIVDLARVRHRVPLAVEQGIVLANAVIRACSEPLLVEARRALGEGERLSFGPVKLDAEGIIVRGAKVAFRDVRLVRIAGDRLEIFRGPLLPWRVVRLGDVPNPDVLCRLVASRVPGIERDAPLLGPLD